MQELVEQTIDAHGRRGVGGRRRVTVNRRESPLAWLAARQLVSARQNEAGERLQADHTRAALGAAVTMRWTPRVDGGAGERVEPAAAQLAAKQRFDAAIGAVGPGLSDVLWRVVCAGETLPDSERALGWPTRSGRLVLTLALDRLADHYRLP